MVKQIFISIGFVALGALGTIYFMNQQGHVHGEEFCTRHSVAEAECPWCDSSLISKLGMCPEHKVPEALCSRCNVNLIPGFKAENDWCAGHGLPESQCAKCMAGDLPEGEKPK
ncbi:hypothetical protein HOF92_17170 [bacterium]|jgi:hypothetical protein|nr:hypothetical protein [bacterium]